MRASLDQLARNLASGVSRRKALWQFVSSLGVVGALTGRKAYADIRGHHHGCERFCEEQADLFQRICMQASEDCSRGYCAEFSLFGINGTMFSAGSTVHAQSGIGINGGLFICVPLDDVPV